MRDKVLSIITLTSIFSLFLYYKMTPENNAVNVVEKNNIMPENQIVINLIDDIEKANVEPETDDGICNFDNEQTDELSFSNAFKYYRDCLGKDKTFSWNENIYSTQLSNEIEVVNIATHNSGQADKSHLDLQNEIIGNLSD